MENVTFWLYVFLKFSWSFHVEVFRLLALSCSIVFQQFNELLDHIKFDHGYTASSPPILNVGDAYFLLFGVFVLAFHLMIFQSSLTLLNVSY